ncbi:neuroguidin-A-like [Hordeum vulgare subsp. vulgare]|uniref:Neuroguidin n=1 Tax=Hordeum vulgare subsp. vulgare TaxID=112509 RepID=A0A8I6YJS7_HORVV|nr:neuroguidin-A-like [Hordeum vulgare subsp. vulgare]
MRARETKHAPRVFSCAQPNPAAPSSGRPHSPLPSGALLRSATAPAPGGSCARAAAPYRRPPGLSPSRAGRETAMTATVAGADDDRKAQALVRDDAPKLLAALKEMKDGLDLVRSKVESLTRKVRKNQLPTGDGIGYLEAKHHLLLSYCQDLVYYLLRKANGLSVDGHPVVRSLVEIRLFLEKIRPIDKKMEYQIQKLTNAADGAAAQDKVPDAEVNVKGRQQGEDDLLGYRPNPDMMDPKIVPEGQGKDGIYVPPRIGPAAMDDSHSKDAVRKEKRLLRMATENPYFKEMIDDAADRPEEWKETAGDESKEFMAYMRQREKQEKAEEELFTRAPVTKREKYMEKQMKKQLHGLQGLTDGFDLGMNTLLDGEKEEDGDSIEPRRQSAGHRKHQKGGKRKRH